MELVERFLRLNVSADPGDIADCYADTVTIEMPFAPAGLIPARIETTREELRARFAAGTAIRRYTAVSDVTIHRTLDPDVVITEYRLHGTMTATGAPFTLNFLLVLTIRDGLIAHSRDYTDPIAGARVLGRLPDLLATLTT